MRKITCKFVLLFSVFIAGIFASTACFNNSSTTAEKYASSDSPILSFCELANNPEKYDGKTVRVSAAVNMLNIHGYMIFDPAKCSTEEKKSTFGAVKFPNTQDSETINKLILENKPESGWYKPVNIIARGKFSYVKSLGTTDGVEDRTSLHFEILELETASISDR